MCKLSIHLEPRCDNRSLSHANISIYFHNGKALKAEREAAVTLKMLLSQKHCFLENQEWKKNKGSFKSESHTWLEGGKSWLGFLVLFLAFFLNPLLLQIPWLCHLSCSILLYQSPFARRNGDMWLLLSWFQQSLFSLLPSLVWWWLKTTGNLTSWAVQVTA